MMLPEWIKEEWVRTGFGVNQKEEENPGGPS
jgi:hypothetical protein